MSRKRKTMGLLTEQKSRSKQVMIILTKKFQKSLSLGSLTCILNKFQGSILTTRFNANWNTFCISNYDSKKETGLPTLPNKNTRMFSTLPNSPVSISSGLKFYEECRDFMAVFPDIVRDIAQATKNYKANDAAKWYERVLQYNVPKGKVNRGILTFSTYKNLVNSNDITRENLKLAAILGWCVEFLQCFFLIPDDVMDNSFTRRGQICWHKLEDVGLIAINDSIVLECAIYVLLKKYFSHMKCYIDLMELFHEITFITIVGQSLDMLNGKRDVTSFSMDNYNTNVANKTSYYSFYLPFALAMHLAGIEDQNAFQQSKKILLDIGHFFQVQDDFLDCFGNPEITGKIGTDIRDNKCTWFAVKCMEIANEEQKQIMVECYGKDDPEKVTRVKELYNELNLLNTYSIYEDNSYNMIKGQIVQFSVGVPHEIFLNILNKIYKRNK